MKLTQINLDSGNVVLKLHLLDMKRKSLNFLHGSIVRSVQEQDIHNILIEFNETYAFFTPYAKATLLKLIASLGIIQNKKINVALVSHNRLLSVALQALLRARLKDTQSFSLSIDGFTSEESAVEWLNLKNSEVSSA